MENKDKEQYLPEDQDVLDQLSKNLEGIYAREALPKENMKTEIESLQIKSILRSRKTMIDLDKSNKRFSIVLGIFALIQIIIAGLQFVLDVSTSTNKGLAIFLAVAFVIIMIWVIKEMEGLLKEKTKK